ncbi:MAG: thermosome subunit beta, partial [Candidatus Bathyarchaeia archaeon]
KPDDERILKSVAKTAIDSKIVAGAQEHLANIVVKATKGIIEEVDGQVKVDLDYVKIEKQGGGALTDTFFVDGVAVDREITHPDMPKHVEDAKIALINGALEVKEVKGKDLADVKLQINAPSQIRAFLDKETRIIKCMVEKIKSSGANVALINRGMNDLAIYYLARARIPAWKRIFTSDMEKIARITGGKLVKVDELTPEALGHAKVVEERKVGEEKYLLVRGVKSRRASTIFIRGGTKHVIEDAERAVRDALCAVRDSIEDGKAIVGGGAAEIEISKHLKDFAKEVSGREQLAIEAFAEAVEIIPKTLAENSGLDVIDILSALKAEHGKGNRWTGVDALKKEICSMKDLRVFEPLRVKVHAIKSATEAAIMILRIDDAFFAKRTREEKPPEKPGPEEGWEWEEEPH